MEDAVDCESIFCTRYKSLFVKFALTRDVGEKVELHALLLNMHYQGVGRL